MLERRKGRREKLMNKLVVILFLLASKVAFSADKNVCVEHGGNAYCEAPTLTTWQYNLCDEMAPHRFRSRAWCFTRGGVLANDFSCQGDTPNAESNLVARAVEFSRRVDGGGECTITSDSGWGHISTSFQCWAGGPRHESGFLIRDHRRISVGGECSEVIYALKSRTLVCPAGATKVSIDGKTACLREQEFSGCKIGNPISPLTGKKVQTVTDVALANITLKRTYNSYVGFTPYNRVGGSENFNGNFGNYWRSSFDYRLFILDDDVNPFALSYPDGSIQYFNSQYQPIIMGKPSGRLLETSDGFEFQDAGVKYMFSPEGRLIRYKAEGKQPLKFRYSGIDYNEPINSVLPDAVETNFPIENGLLVDIVDQRDAVIMSFKYDTGSKVVQIQSVDGNFIYGYDANDNLVSVTRNGEILETYIYDHPQHVNALTGVASANGEVYATWDYDANGHATLSKHSEGQEKYSLNYDASTSDKVVTITNPLGKEAIYQYLTIRGERKLVIVEGQESPSGACAAANQYKSYYPNATVQTQTDWEGNVTHFERDNLGRTTKKTEGQKWPGQPQYGVNVDASALQTTANTKITQTCWHPTHNKPERVIEPNRVVIYEYFDSGQLKTKKIETKTAANTACPQ